MLVEAFAPWHRLLAHERSFLSGSGIAKRTLAGSTLSFRNWRGSPGPIRQLSKGRSVAVSIPFPITTSPSSTTYSFSDAELLGYRPEPEVGTDVRSAPTFAIPRLPLDVWDWPSGDGLLLALMLEKQTLLFKPVSLRFCHFGDR